MTEINPDYIELDKEMSGRALDSAPIALLEKIKREGRAWRELSEQYGVDNPDPPWRVNLESTCDNLSFGEDAPLNVCKPAGAQKGAAQKLDAVERRWEEDQLAEALYAEVPFPERALLALAHTMIRRGILSEAELAAQMKKVGDRLNMVAGAYRDEQPR